MVTIYVLTVFLRQTSNQLKTPPDGMKRPPISMASLSVVESKTAKNEIVSGVLWSPKELSARPSSNVGELLKLVIRNEWSESLRLPLAGAAHFELHQLHGGTVSGSYSRDASRQVSSHTEPLAHGESFVFDRFGYLGVDRDHRVQLSLSDETGGVTTYSGLLPGKFFFTATYDAGAMGGKRYVLHLTGTSFLLR